MKKKEKNKRIAYDICDCDDCFYYYCCINPKRYEFPCTYFDSMSARKCIGCSNGCRYKMFAKRQTVLQKAINHPKLFNKKEIKELWELFEDFLDENNLELFKRIQQTKKEIARGDYYFLDDKNNMIKNRRKKSVKVEIERRKK